MRKSLISSAFLASLLVSGCSWLGKDGGTASKDAGSILERIPFVYRPDIQQGNLLDQVTVNRLKPGLTKPQVRYLMGTPMLRDPFHADRWDYVYTMKKGNGPREMKRLTVFFENGRLVRLEGDYRPQPGEGAPTEVGETLVEVPDWVDPNAGILASAVRGVKQGVKAIGETLHGKDTPAP